MALIDNEDIQTHLPRDKFDIEVSDYPDDIELIKLDVERVIRGRLSGTFAPETLALWATPAETPELIRAIGGRLAAAFMYRQRLAEDYPEDSDYAIGKYQEAMMWLDMIVAGSITLPEVEEEVDTGGHLTVGHFNENLDPKFTMDSIF